MSTSWISLNPNTVYETFTSTGFPAIRFPFINIEFHIIVIKFCDACSILQHCIERVRWFSYE